MAFAAARMIRSQAKPNDNKNKAHGRRIDQRSRSKVRFYF